MGLTLTLYGLTVPAKWEVCDRCRGEGHHTNPAIDGNGITQDEMDELGDDFREDYMSGVYDIPCEECHGERLIMVIEEGRATPEQIKEYMELVQEEADYRAECRAEQRMGA